MLIISDVSRIGKYSLHVTCIFFSLGGGGGYEESVTIPLTCVKI